MPSSKRSKILIVMIVLIMLSSGFAYGIPTFGKAIDHSNNEVKGDSYFRTSSGTTSVAGNDVSGNQYRSNLSMNQRMGGASDALRPDSNRLVWLGSFNGSYLQPICIPVYSSNLGIFDNLTQMFSYDPSVLSFNSILNDVASGNVTFSYSILTPGIVKVHGIGAFKATYPQTILYYLDFNSNVRDQVVTNVSLDGTFLGHLAYSTVSQVSLRLVRGWAEIGPSNISAPGEIVTGGAGTVPAVGYSPYNLSTIYVASGRGGPWQGNLYQGADVNGFGGMFRSVNGGKDWSPIDLGLNSTEVNAIIVNPLNPQELVIATGGINTIVGGGIFKSINGGDSWQETYDLGGNNFVLSNNTLYAASFHSIIYSTDFGTTWNTLASFSSIVTTLSVSNNGSYLYIGVYYSNPDVQILLSTNHGSSFSMVADFPGYYTVSQIAIDPTNNSKLFALVHHGYTNFTSLYRSSDFGKTWVGVNDSAVGINLTQISSISGGTFREAPQAISYDPENGSVFYVIGPGYVYKSIDGGNYFTMLNSYWGSANGGQDNRMISIDPLDDSVIFIGSDQGLIITYNGGKSWTGLDNRSSNMLYDVAADGPHIFTTAQDWAPLFSDNYGKTWYQTQDSEEGFVAVDPYNSSIVLHVPPWNNALYVSNNGGNTFLQSSVNETQLFVQARDTPDAVAFGPNTIYIYGKYGIFYSNDSGRSFSLIPGSPYDYLNGGGTLTVSPSDPAIVYASNWNKLYVSHNYGFNWTEVNDLIPTGTGQIGSIAVDPLNYSIIFFDIYRWYTTDTLYESLNGGKTYEYAGISSQDIFAAPPYVNYYDYNGTVYLVYVSGNGTYISTDQGKTWENVDYNVITSVVSSFYLSQNGSAYISTYGSGVWYDPTLFDLNFTLHSPVLTGYLPTNEYLVINGIKLNSTGYFLTELNIGNNTIYVSSLGKEIFLSGSPGGVYFENFSQFRQYSVDFIETGLPPGTPWYLNLSIGQIFRSSSSTIKFNETNGSYNYTVSTPYKLYSPRPSSGLFVVNGSSVLASIVFILVTYNVTFSESGLSAGTSWSVTLNNESKSSPSNTIIFSEHNGTYSYSIGKMTGYTVLAQSGVVTVNGKSVSESIIFNQIEQNGYFAGSVSPPNAIISILINGSWESYKETNGSFNISLNPGTYEINVSAPGYEAYRTNITVSSSTVTSLSIHSLSKVSGPSSLPVLLLVIAMIIIVAFVGAAVALARFRKRT